MKIEYERVEYVGAWKTVVEVVSGENGLDMVIVHMDNEPPVFTNKQYAGFIRAEFCRLLDEGQLQYNDVASLRHALGLSEDD